MTLKQKIDEIFTIGSCIFAESNMNGIEFITLTRVISTDANHPEASYKHDNSRPYIAIYSKFDKLPANTHEHVIYHELGHWFREQHIQLKDIMGWEKDENFFIYDQLNSEEGFAEAFATLFTDPKHFKSKYPEQFERMSNWVKPQKNKIIKKTKELLKQYKDDDVL